jgi:hypothetical protein
MSWGLTRSNQVGNSVRSYITEENRLDAGVTDKGRLAADPSAHQAFDLGRAWPVDGVERTPAPRWRADAYD